MRFKTDKDAPVLPTPERHAQDHRDLAFASWLDEAMRRLTQEVCLPDAVIATRALGSVGGRSATRRYIELTGHQSGLMVKVADFIRFSQEYKPSEADALAGDELTRKRIGARNRFGVEMGKLEPETWPQFGARMYDKACRGYGHRLIIAEALLSAGCMHAVPGASARRRTEQQRDADAEANAEHWTR